MKIRMDLKFREEKRASRFSADILGHPVAAWRRARSRTFKRARSFLKRLSREFGGCKARDKGGEMRGMPHTWGGTIVPRARQQTRVSRAHVRYTLVPYVPYINGDTNGRHTWHKAVRSPWCWGLSRHRGTFFLRGVAEPPFYS